MASRWSTKHKELAQALQSLLSDAAEGSAGDSLEFEADNSREALRLTDQEARILLQLVLDSFMRCAELALQDLTKVSV